MTVRRCCSYQTADDTGLVVPLPHLVVYSLVHFCFIVQNHKRLGGFGLAVENEAEISALTLHISEVYESGVKSKSREERVCEECSVLLFKSKTSPRPGYQLFTALNTQRMRIFQTVLPDVKALLVDFTSIRWQHPGQQWHWNINDSVNNNKYFIESLRNNSYL